MNKNNCISLPFWYFNFTQSIRYIYWCIPFAVILMIEESNAVNLTDGFDGLAIGLVMLVFITFSILTYLSSCADYSAYLGIPYIESIRRTCKALFCGNWSLYRFSLV